MVSWSHWLPTILLLIPLSAVAVIALLRGDEIRVAIDGLSYQFVVLTTLLFPLLCAAGWNDRSNGRAFFATLLALQCALLGFLLSSDFLWIFLCLATIAVVAWRLLLHDDK